MAYDLKKSISEGISNYALSRGVLGPISTTEEFRKLGFNTQGITGEEISALIAYYNEGVHSGDYGTFFTEYTKKDKAKDLRRDEDFEKAYNVVVGNKETVQGYDNKADALSSRAFRKASVKGNQEPAKFWSTIAAASYSQQTYEENKPYRDMLRRVQHGVMKKFVEKDKTSVGVELKSEIARGLEGILGVDLSSLSKAINGTLVPNDAYSRVRGYTVSPNGEGNKNPSEVKFSYNMGKRDGSLSNIGVNATALAARQAVSILARPFFASALGCDQDKFMAGYASLDPESEKAYTFESAFAQLTSDQQKAYESMLSSYEGESMNDISARYSLFAGKLSEMQVIKDLDNDKLSKFLTACATQGAFAQLEESAFLRDCYVAATQVLGQEGGMTYTTIHVEKKDENGNPILGKDGKPVSERVEVPCTTGSIIVDGEVVPIDFIIKQDKDGKPVIKDGKPDYKDVEADIARAQQEKENQHLDFSRRDDVVRYSDNAVARELAKQQGKSKADELIKKQTQTKKAQGGTIPTLSCFRDLAYYKQQKQQALESIRRYIAFPTKEQPAEESDEEEDLKGEPTTPTEQGQNGTSAAENITGENAQVGKAAEGDNQAEAATEGNSPAVPAAETGNGESQNSTGAEPNIKEKGPYQSPNDEGQGMGQ